MRLLNTHTLQLEEEIFSEEKAVKLKYAILSHTWGEFKHEVSFKDMTKHREAAEKKSGFQKIRSTCKRAREDGLDYAWIDTCCINQKSSQELTESINSMFRWYQQSEVCYVYLSGCKDSRRQSAIVEESLPASQHISMLAVKQWPNRDADPGDENTPLLGPSVSIKSNISSKRKARQKRTQSRLVPKEQRRLRESLDQYRWFQRGWTLQELLAPRNVQFFDHAWNWIGQINKAVDTGSRNGSVQPYTMFESAISDITGIHEDALTGRLPITSFSIAQRMCWAAGRQTSKLEDRYYSLLGIFGISMPIIYGEGERGFQRLQEELLRISSDQTIFAWTSNIQDEQATTLDWQQHSPSVLASSPDSFKDCGKYVPAQKSEQRADYQLTMTDIRMELPIFTELVHDGQTAETRVVVHAVLGCRIEDDEGKVLVVELEPVTGATDTYIIKGGVNRVMQDDHYKAWTKSSAKTVTILRRAGIAQHTMSRAFRHDQYATILCRFKSTRGLRPWMKCLKDPYKAWQEHPSECFVLKAGETGLFAKLEINVGDSTYAIIALHRRNDGTFYAAFEPHKHSSRAWRAVALLSPLPMNIHNYVVMVATIGPRKLLNSTSIVLEIETVGLSRVLYPLTRYACKIAAKMWNKATETWDTAFWALMYELQMLFAILVPILVVIIARITAYRGSKMDGDTTLEVEEIVLLVLAMPAVFIGNFLIELGRS